MTYSAKPAIRAVSSLIALAVAFAAPMAALGPAQAADLAEIEERGVLRVAISPLTPFVIKNDDGSYSGLEIDSTTALGEELGVKIEYVEKPFCELAAAIVEDEADIIASGYSNMPNRRRVLDFSLPYHDTEYFLVLEKGAAKKRKTLRAVNAKELTIGYQEGGVSGQVARGEFYGATLKAFSSFADVMAALREGTIDGAVMFSPYDDLIKRNKKPKYSVPHEYALTRTIEAFGLDKDSGALRDRLNEWIIRQDLQGFWDGLEEKWFDPENAEVGALPADSCPALLPTG